MSTSKCDKMNKDWIILLFSLNITFPLRCHIWLANLKLNSSLIELYGCSQVDTTLTISQRHDDSYVLVLEYYNDILYARLQGAICLCTGLCTCAAQAHVSMTPTLQTHTKCITTSHTPQCDTIDDKYTVRCPRYDDTMLRSLCCFITQVHSGRQKTGQFLALFFTASTMSHSL
jgi:hypothetical protein